MHRVSAINELLIGGTLPVLAIENGDFLWIYQLKMVIFQFAMLVYQRVSNYSNCCRSAPKLSHFSLQTRH